MTQSRAGNAMVYVLVGIMLFAALAYTFMRTGQSAGSNMSKQQAKLAAQEIVHFGNLMEQAVNKVRQKYCSETQINFRNSSEGDYINTNAPGEGYCDIFESTGGGMTWQNPPAGSNDGTTYRYVGGPVLHTINGQNSSYTSAHADLVMYLFNINQTLCQTINETLGIPGVPVDEGYVPLASTTKFVGDFLPQENITGLPGSSIPSPCIATPGAGLCGRKAGCFLEAGGDKRYIFYKILLPR